MITQKVRQFILICLILISSISYAGTESGGGGHVVYDQSQEAYILADFWQIDKSFIDQNIFLNFKSSRLENELLNIKLKNKVDLKEIHQTSAFSIAFHILNQWSKLPFDLISIHIKAGIMAPVSWSFTDAILEAPVNFQSSSTYDPNRQYLTAAYYRHDKQDYRVQISRALWNKSRLFTQSGIIIHESLRHIQIGRSENFNEDNLQKATAILTMCKPDITLGQYTYFLMINAADEALKNMGSFESVITKFCTRIDIDNEKE